MSPKSECGDRDSGGGESSGNESPTPDHETARTPDPRGKPDHIQTCVYFRVILLVALPIIASRNLGFPDYELRRLAIKCHFC